MHNRLPVSLHVLVPTGNIFLTGTASSFQLILILLQISVVCDTANFSGLCKRSKMCQNRYKNCSNMFNPWCMFNYQ